MMKKEGSVSNKIIRKGSFRRALGSSSHDQCIRTIVDTSRLELFGKGDSHGIIWLLMRFHGTAAALPSTTNNRMLTVPRHHVIKHLRQMLDNPVQRSHAEISSVIREVQCLRGFLTKNPEQVQQLQALTCLYEAVRGQRTIDFKTDPKKRALVMMMLSPDLNRNDSHNIPKAFCDWLEDMKIISNDRHVDAFARRKSDHGIAGQSSDVVIMRYPEASSSVDAMMQPMLDIIHSVELRSGKVTPTQTSLPLKA